MTELTGAEVAAKLLLEDKGMGKAGDSVVNLCRANLSLEQAFQLRVAHEDTVWSMRIYFETWRKGQKFLDAVTTDVRRVETFIKQQGFALLNEGAALEPIKGATKGQVYIEVKFQLPEKLAQYNR